ncbi:MAG: hypothetical protein JW808_10600 [Victivallales bacterium]|nr:hypothetical protein [Victivallales bacterium]
MENEFQTAIEGCSEDVDLPCRIKDSSFFRNVRRRVHSGDMPQRCERKLNDFISCNDQNVWENSWASFPRSRLNAYAESVLEHDLLADKSNPSKGKRCDWRNFDDKGKLRLPVSYILKLALADVIGRCGDRNSKLRKTGERLLDHFLNDNTSPEIHSFYVSPMKQSRGMGKAAARETLQRFLVIQLLAAYANRKFNISAGGQKIKLYFAPHPPVRQKLLNQLIPDSFYRNLFMSPCLSGWDKGEEKMEYMGLCHRVMSRSHLNTIHKLKEAGIINNDLVVMPNTSNISLANNGTHISLGSRKLSGLLAAGHKDFGAAQEKYIGDLVIKIVEHFLPLFVGTCSAAPYRLDFEDFHPEKILGFLSHELDFTHLRMIWRRWKKKAKLKFLGHPFRPYGPQWLDSRISKLFFLKGDYIPDFRLIDYLVALMSTDENPALDGKLGNDLRLKNDLQDCGVFDSSMSLYMLYKLRQHSVMGFSGFEGRFYSLFHSLRDDMAVAADMQLLVTALAYKYVLSGKIKPELPIN